MVYGTLVAAVGECRHRYEAMYASLAETDQAEINGLMGGLDQYGWVNMYYSS